jgi:hypothetical protein
MTLAHVPRSRRRLLKIGLGLFAAAVATIGLATSGNAISTAKFVSSASTAAKAAAPIVLPVSTCSSIAGHDFATLKGAPTSVTSATVVAATTASPAYCDVLGYVQPQIQFEVRLPTTTWNGDFFQTGCGGFCGAIPISSCGQALNTNFAVAAENSGHVGSSELDGLWAYNDAGHQLEIDFGYLSPHVVALASKALIDYFYGQPPAYSYFDGCSTGGRQALSEAERYPLDFNGIVAGDPALQQNYLPIEQGWVERVNRDAHGNLILTDAQLPLLHNAVLAKCDLLDGHADGVLDNPSKCHFNPGTLTCRANQDPTMCLTPAQIKVVRDFYQGPTTSSGKVIMPGLAVGSELGWAGTDIGTNTTPSGAGAFATQVLDYLAFPKDPGPKYTIEDLNLNTAMKQLSTMAKIYDADNANLTAFHKDGGKLMLYHGGADPLISTQTSVNFYNAAVKINGSLRSTQKWFDFFELPGVFHCTGGAGASTVNWLGYIQNWVEHGISPSTITATTSTGGIVTLTRILRPYPAAPVQ